MLIDINDIEDGRTLEADICIVGAGTAGLTLAHELDGRGVTVCVIESGGLEVDGETQALNAGEVVGEGMDVLRSRSRVLGGTLEFWDGRCCLLDPIDFEKRDWVPDSGWPIGFDDLYPYYGVASEKLGLPGVEYFDLGVYDDRFGANVIGSTLGSGFASPVFQWAPSTARFGRSYRAQIEQSHDVNVYLNATVVEIENSVDASRVSRLKIKTLQSKSYYATAKVFVVAAGGLETPRVLLASTGTFSNGIGNQNDLVGRYFGAHPRGTHGWVLPSGKVSTNSVYLRQLPVDGGSLRAGIRIPEEDQRENKLLNHYMLLEPVSYSTHNKARQLISGGKSTHHKFLVESGVPPASVLGGVGHMVAARVRRALGAPGRADRFYLRNYIEQVPNPDSRVTLGDTVDSFGMPKLKLDWRITDQDKDSVVRVHKLMGQRFVDSGLGRFESRLDELLDEWPISSGNSHHMSTTRMHDDPKRGVTDGDGRVHGTDNLYISGPSVFTTSGYANPTLTIVALALRQAEHLKSVLE